MKKINNSLLNLYVLVTLAALLVSCGTSGGLTDREIFIERMTGTWEVTEESSIILNDQDITRAFIGFEISIANDLTFTTNSDNLTIDEFPWPITGSFELNDDLNLLTRDDGLMISITIDDILNEINLEFEKDDSGRTKGVRGGWKCKMKKK